MIANQAVLEVICFVYPFASQYMKRQGIIVCIAGRLYVRRIGFSSKYLVALWVAVESGRMNGKEENQIIGI